MADESGVPRGTVASWVHRTKRFRELYEQHAGHRPSESHDLASSRGAVDIALQLTSLEDLWALSDDDQRAAWWALGFDALASGEWDEAGPTAAMLEQLTPLGRRLFDEAGAIIEARHAEAATVGADA